MPLTLSGSGGITYPDGTVNTTRSVSTAGDTMTGNLVAPRLLTNAQIGSVQWNGDIDGAKWSTKLGGYFLTFLNPDTGSTASIDGNTYSVDGLTWREKARIHPEGYIQVAQGIRFPATQNQSSNANTLDDYEEGSWTPYVTFDGPNDSTYSERSGRYTKVGNLVTVVFKIILSGRGSGGTGLARVYGLPFNIAPMSGITINPIGSGSLLVGGLSGVTGTLNIWLDNNGSGLIPYSNENGGGSFTFHGNWTNTTWVTGTATYHTNA